MSSWKTTLAGVLYAVVEAINTLPDFSALSWTELGVRASKVALVAAIGILSKDAK